MLQINMHLMMYSIGETPHVRPSGKIAQPLVGQDAPFDDFEISCI